MLGAPQPIAASRSRPRPPDAGGCISRRQQVGGGGAGGGCASAGHGSPPLQGGELSFPRGRVTIAPRAAGASLGVRKSHRLRVLMLPPSLHRGAQSACEVEKKRTRSHTRTLCDETPKREASSMRVTRCMGRWVAHPKVHPLLGRQRLALEQSDDVRLLRQLLHKRRGRGGQRGGISSCAQAKRIKQALLHYSVPVRAASDGPRRAPFPGRAGPAASSAGAGSRRGRRGTWCLQEARKQQETSSVPLTW